MIDVHAHWRPAETANALRAREREPRILRNDDGAEVLKMPRMAPTLLSDAFDEVDFHIHRMDRQGVRTSVLSVVGGFCWIESQPLAISGPLCRSVNDRFSAICQEHPGRFAAFAALPLTDMGAAATELTPPVWPPRPVWPFPPRPNPTAPSPKFPIYLSRTWPAKFSS